MLIKLHSQATTTPKVGATIQPSDEPAWVLAERHGTTERTAWKWRKRAATGEQEFDKRCADIGTKHRLTPPKSPQTKGMVERLNGRIEEVLSKPSLSIRRGARRTGCTATYGSTTNNSCNQP